MAKTKAKYHKSLKYNNGLPIDFDIIKNNRIQAVKEISEGNKGLEKLLNTCIDLNIETITSCGDIDPYISFALTENNKEYMFNLCTQLLNNSDIKNNFFVSISIEENSSCTFYLNNRKKPTSLDKEQFFYIINNSILMNNDLTYNLDFISNFCYFSKLAYDAHFQNNIDFSINSKNNIETKISLFGYSSEEIEGFVKDYFSTLVYSDEEPNFLDNMKFYKVINYEEFFRILNISKVLKLNKKA